MAQARNTASMLQEGAQEQTILGRCARTLPRLAGSRNTRTASNPCLPSPHAQFACQHRISKGEAFHGECACVPAHAHHQLHATACACLMQRRPACPQSGSKHARAQKEAHRRTYSMAVRTVASVLPSSTTITSYVNVGPFLSRFLCRYLQTGQLLSTRQLRNSTSPCLVSHQLTCHAAPVRACEFFM